MRTHMPSYSYDGKQVGISTSTKASKHMMETLIKTKTQSNKHASRSERYRKYYRIMESDDPDKQNLQFRMRNKFLVQSSNNIKMMEEIYGSMKLVDSLWISILLNSGKLDLPKKSSRV